MSNKLQILDGKVNRLENYGKLVICMSLNYFTISHF